MKINVLIIGLVGLLFIPTVIADDGSGCGEMQGGLWTAECYLPNIYHQNNILIQEQNQTNHLLAYSYCKGTPDHIEFSDGHTTWIYNSTMGNPFQDCVKKVLGDTK